MRSPFTGIVFAMELTHDFNILLPLLVANVLAYAVSVLVLKRSILTEKVSRRGYHLSREYSVDPLEILFVREVMRTHIAAFSAATKVEEATHHLRPDHSPRGQHLYPVLDAHNHLAGMITRKDLRKLAAEHKGARAIGEFVRFPSVIAYANEPLRAVVDRMAASGFTRMPVLDPDDGGKLVGMVSLDDLLHARVRNLSEERDRQRVIRIRLPFGSAATADKES